MAIFCDASSSRVIDRGHSLHFSYKDEFVILTGYLILIGIPNRKIKVLKFFCFQCDS